MKILALTSIRSDYDLLSSLYKLLDQDKDIDFRLLVSGAHLSVENGYTKQYIEQDGFQILQEIETLISSDSLKSKLKTASIFLQGSIDVVSNFSPDVILYAGDREDVILASLATGTSLAGLVLTGGIIPHPSILEMIKRYNLPTLMVREDTYTTASRIHDITVKVKAEDEEKIRIISELIENYVDVEAIYNAL